jgi:hypothetical protein
MTPLKTLCCVHANTVLGIFGILALGWAKRPAKSFFLWPAKTEKSALNQDFLPMRDRKVFLA